MKEEIKELEINGVTYVPKSEAQSEAVKLDGLEYKLIRADRAGVFAGFLESQEGSTVVLKNARRIWAWYGACSLSQLATDGTSKPNDCKFPCEIAKIQVLGVIEILDVTAKAQKSIQSVPVWAK